MAADNTSRNTRRSLPAGEAVSETGRCRPSDSACIRRFPPRENKNAHAPSMPHYHERIGKARGGTDEGRVVIASVEHNQPG